MNDRTLDDPLKTGGRLGIGWIIRHQIGQILFDKSNQAFAQNIKIDIARAHDGCGIWIIDQGQQEMLERRIFVTPLIRQSERPVQSLFKGA